MKKLFTLLAIGLLVFTSENLSAQSQRLVLAEEFTQASCGPCASQNPAFNTLLQANTDKIVSIKYQTSWPGADPMNADNPTEVQNRVDLYAVDGVPTGIIDGTYIPICSGAYEGSPSCLTQSGIDASYAIPAAFDIAVDASVANGILNVTTDVNCTQDVSGNFKLYVVLIEKVIDWGTAPGSNGEVIFYNVMKKFLPGVTGIDIPGTWTNGESNSYSNLLNTNEVNIYDMSQLAVVAFIQDMSSKDVFQAGIDMEVAITTEFDNSASAVEISGLPEALCTGEQTISPVFKIQNNGNNALTSALITYNINGGDDQIYNWTGDLITLETENVTLDPYTFTSGEENLLTTIISMPNGVEDEDSTSNNTQTSMIGLAPMGNLDLTIDINTDCWPDETSWEIRNSENGVVASGGTYNNQAETEIIENVTLPANDCYEFILRDVYGDGMHGSQWSDCSTDGNLTVTDAMGTVLFSYDGSFNLSELIRNFEGTSVTGIEEISSISNFNIYPNPTGNVAHIAMNLLESNSVKIEVVDLLGKVVYSEEMGNLPAGYQLFDVDASSIGNGMYLFNIYVGQQKVTERVSISK